MAATVKNVAINTVTLDASPSNPSVKLAPFTVPNKMIKTAGIKNTPRFKYLPCVKGISIEVPVCV